VNSSQIWQVANNTGWDDEGQNTTASLNPPCTVNALFCVPFTKAYEQSYEYHIPYWAGVKAGNKYADLVIDICTQINHLNFGSYSSIQKRILGWLWGFCSSS
jgi:hypothetical protein